MTEMKFKDLKISKDILKALELLGFNEPTKVQEEVIPKILKEKDVVVQSQTGSGKTGAFGIPVCELIDWAENMPQALVITPTRELALQVKEELFCIGRFKRLKIPVLIGKAPFHIQQKELKQKSHIVVGTPGRILDHLEKGSFNAQKVKYLVLDEADEMFNMGFLEQIEEVLKWLPNERVTLLFSATMPKGIKKLCLNYLNKPTYITIESETLTADQIKQIYYEVEEHLKFELLQKVLIVENPYQCTVFCNTKQQVDKVQNNLEKQGYMCDKIHGGMEQRDRLRVMENFKKGYFRYLIATDVASRGIDIEGISHVVNYDLPLDEESYVHRIGRTGRKGNSGKSISFVTDQERSMLERIKTYTQAEINHCLEPNEGQIECARNEFEAHRQLKIKKAPSKEKNLEQEILKLHINAGKKTKMRPVDIVGTLCNLEGMTAEDIGIITIKDVSTFVEILNNKGESVYKALQNRPIKGRIRKVSRADD